MIVITDELERASLHKVKLALEEGISQRHIDSLSLLTHHDFANKVIKLAYELVENYYATGLVHNGYNLGELNPKVGLCSLIQACSNAARKYYESMYIDKTNKSDAVFQWRLVNYFNLMENYVRIQLGKASIYTYLDYIGHKKLGAHYLSERNCFTLVNYIVPYKEARSLLKQVESAMHIDGHESEAIYKQQFTELYGVAYRYYSEEAYIHKVRLPLAPELAKAQNISVAPNAATRAKVLTKLFNSLRTNEIIIK